ncbi:MAG TPA: peptidoglycan-binding domain-containing protein [Acidobacteriaceae bacterium]|nr:peptidoglycan-binding domain-containing protein [Acidobacteriaceae bacterium]
MVSFRACQIVVLGACLIAAPAFAGRTHRSATSGHAAHHRTTRHHAHVLQGQRQIDPERAQQIQDALIREHYLSAPASGQWDASTEAAMQKYQADHGWQTKLTPDARALIKLGLGPQNDGGQVIGASGVGGDIAAPAATVSADAPAAANTLAADHPSDEK